MDAAEDSIAGCGEYGAKQIGRGLVGSGFKDMFTGIGHTVVTLADSARKADPLGLAEPGARCGAPSAWRNRS